MKLTRRSFLGSAVGVVGVALLEGCQEKLPRYLVPYSAPPDDLIPGLSRQYRTVCRECPAGCGATVRVREGRALKMEGSPEHPISLGGLCPGGQSAIERLYAPTRLAAPMLGGAEVGWDKAEAALADGLGAALAAGKRVVVLTRPERGQLGTLLGAWLGALGQSAGQVVTFDPMERAWLREGQRRAFGSTATPVQDLAAAKVLLSIGDDFVEEGSPVEAARALADQRAAGGRSIYVGPRLSLTAASADRWISVEPGTELVLVLGLARQVLDQAPARGALSPALLESLRLRLAPCDAASVASRTRMSHGSLVELAQALLGASPSLVVGPGRAVAGGDAPVLAEAVHVLNALLGNLGATLRFLPSPAHPAAMELAEFIRRASAGEVGAVILHHVDPLGYGPGQAALAKALASVPFVAAFTNELDATSRQAHLVLADHHFLESWSDVTPRPGVTGIQQPVMTPVLGTRPAADLLLAAARTLGKTGGLPEGSFAELVRAAFTEKEIEQGGRFEAVAPVPVALLPTALAQLPPTPPLRGPGMGLPLVVAPNIRHLDGRSPRSSLLRELPDPLSGFSWTGWVELHPTTAAALQVKAGDVVALEGPGGHVELPAHVTAAIRAGLVGVPVGDALGLLDANGPIGLGARVTALRTGLQRPLHLPEEGRHQHGRELSRSVSREAPRIPPQEPLPSMYPAIVHPERRWGLGIDLDRCTGCGACSAACYVENNLPIVGPEDMQRGRSMSWLRIQSFVEETAEGLEASFLPLGCQHCANAPCEVVCPTFATYHTQEGLNAQVYARCIGTRYCENNCPYGVRRFNFFEWPRLGNSRLGLNPDVSVRDRGVSEKCSLCIHRIGEGEEQARMEGRKQLRDGEIISACAATCPTRAIVFGDLMDPGSEISRRAADGRSYKLLGELNTEPGVVYLARRWEKA